MDVLWSLAFPSLGLCIGLTACCRCCRCFRLQSTRPPPPPMSSDSSSSQPQKGQLQKAGWENEPFPLGGARVPKGMEEHANWQDLPEVRQQHRHSHAGSRQPHRQ